MKTWPQQDNVFLILVSTTSPCLTELEPFRETFLPLCLWARSYMHEVFQLHFSVTFPCIKRPSRDKRKKERERKWSQITNIFSVPPAKDFLTVSVTQPRTRLCKGSTRDFGISPISCRCGHAHSLTAFYFQFQHTWKILPIMWVSLGWSVCPHCCSALMEQLSSSSIDFSE